MLSQHRGLPAPSSGRYTHCSVSRHAAGPSPVPPTFADLYRFPRRRKESRVNRPFPQSTSGTESSNLSRSATQSQVCGILQGMRVTQDVTFRVDQVLRRHTTCAISSWLTLRTTTRSGLISHWTKMRRISAVLHRSAPSRQFRSLAGCIINTSGFRF
jgi:hypothetical protein